MGPRSNECSSAIHRANWRHLSASWASSAQLEYVAAGAQLVAAAAPICANVFLLLPKRGRRFSVVPPLLSDAPPAPVGSQPQIPPRKGSERASERAGETKLSRSARRRCWCEKFRPMSARARTHKTNTLRPISSPSRPAGPPPRRRQTNEPSGGLRAAGVSGRARPTRALIERSPDELCTIVGRRRRPTAAPSAPQLAAGLAVRVNGWPSAWPEARPHASERASAHSWLPKSRQKAKTKTEPQSSTLLARSLTSECLSRVGERNDETRRNDTPGGGAGATHWSGPTNCRRTSKRRAASPLKCVRAQVCLLLIFFHYQLRHDE